MTILLTLFSCVNTNKIEIKSVSKASIRSLSLSSFSLSSDVVVSNRTSKIEIKEIYADIFHDNSSIAILKVDEPILVNKGTNEIPINLKISLKNGLFGYASVISAFSSDIKNVKITGYIVVKGPLGSKKIKFENYPLNNLASQKSFEGVLKNTLQ